MSIFTFFDIKFNVIVCKFGGTAVTEQNVSKIKRIVRLSEERSAVVVSAVGKSFDSDVKATDLLISLHSQLPNSDLYEKIKYKYLSLAEKCCFDMFEANRLLDDCLSQIVCKNNYAFTVSRGEYLSALMVSRLLNYKFVDSAEVIKFGKSKINQSLTDAALKPYKNSKIVLGGFYGSDQSGIRLFDRGGSDITGAVVSCALQASMYENWTDVNGFLATNPKKVLNPLTVECIDYAQIESLTKAGADVLHYKSVKPVAAKGIPVCIRNFYNYANSGTLVSYFSLPNRVFGISTKKFQNDVYLTKIVFTAPLCEIFKRIAVVFEKKSGMVKKIAYFNGCLSMTACYDFTKEIYLCLRDLI